MHHANRIPALECIIGIPYQDFRIYFFFKLQYELTFLINTVCKHEQSYSRGVTANGELFNSFLQITGVLPTALILTDWTENIVLH